MRDARRDHPHDDGRREGHENAQQGGGPHSRRVVWPDPPQKGKQSRGRHRFCGIIGRMLLFRPVGPEELRLLYESGMRAWPPRLPDQPIFYPVTNHDYAAQIARDWNTKSGSRAGFVTRFEVDDAYVTRFDRRVVGAREHEELWVPAEELPTFNAHIRGAIAVTAAFYGPDYAPKELIADAAQESPAATFVDFFYWESVGARAAALETIRAKWTALGRDAIPLGVVG